MATRSRHSDGTIMTDSAARALRVLQCHEPCPDGPQLKREQVLAADARDWYALELWSRLRFSWLRSTGRLL